MPNDFPLARNRRHMPSIALEIEYEAATWIAQQKRLSGQKWFGPDIGAGLFSRIFGVGWQTSSDPTREKKKGLPRCAHASPSNLG
jgi:hypothetical protein